MPRLRCIFAIEFKRVLNYYNFQSNFTARLHVDIKNSKLMT